MGMVVPLQVFGASGALSVSQSSVAHGSIARGAQRVPFLSLVFSADCAADAVVHELTVKHEGFGDSADLESVYAADGYRRLTRARAFARRDRTLILPLAPPLTVPACASRTVTILADIAPDADVASEHRLRIDGASSLVSDVPVTSVVRPVSVGSVHVTFLDLLQPLRYGTKRTLARMQFTADGERDQEIVSVLMTNDGKARDDDLQHLFIQNRKGEVFTTVQRALDGDRVRLYFDPPLRLDRHDTILLELKGDIRASRRRTIRFILEEASDLEATVRMRR